MKFSKNLLVVSVIALMCGLYIWPAPQHMWNSDSTKIMSDGTDMTTYPFQVSILQNKLETEPLHLLYGAVATKQLSAPEGVPLWIPHIERVLAIIGASIFGVEQAGTFLVLLIMIASGLSMYALLKKLEVPSLVSLALATTYCCSYFVRARAKVHYSFVSLYHLPLLVLGLIYLANAKTKKDKIMVAVLFLLTVLVPHYFVIMLAVFTPIWLWLYSRLSHQLAAKTKWRNLTIVAIPAVAYLLLSLLFSVPGGYFDKSVSSLPKTGDAAEWPHPFLQRFRSHSIDFFTGDLGLTSYDLNPIKRSLMETIYNDELIPKNQNDLLTMSNTHERTNGIRWTVWVLFAVFLFRIRKDISFKTIGWPIVMVAVCGFLIATNFPVFGGWGLGHLIHKYVLQFRVTSRAGIFVLFAVTVGAALGAKHVLSLLTKKRRQFVEVVLVAVIMLEFPPLLTPMLMAQTVKQEASLPKKDCGYGMYFPHINGFHEQLGYYNFLQTLRGTDCAVFGKDQFENDEVRVLEKFGLIPPVIQRIQSNDFTLKFSYAEFVRCSGQQWIRFDANIVPPQWRLDLCKSVGGKMTSEWTCLRESGVYPARPWRQCI